MLLFCVRQCRKPALVMLPAVAIAHELHHPRICSKLAISSSGAVESRCWGADVTFAFRWEKDTITCTIAGALPEVYSKGWAERELDTSFHIGQAQDVFYVPGGACSKSRPAGVGTAGERYFFLTLIAGGTVFTLYVVLVTVLDMHGIAVPVWCRCLLPAAQDGPWP